MDRERVIVYIDENTDDGMMWEELNQEGQMQVSVYDEELEYDVEYNHSIVVKSLQEYLSDYTKQVRKEVLGKLMNMLGDRAELIDCGSVAEFMFTTYDLQESINEILGETK